MEITFRAKYPWAILPYKHKADWQTYDANADTYERYFRWFRRRRIPQRCWPWRLGQEVGWLIPSPVDITMSPIEDTEISCSSDELEYFGRATGYTEFWQRGESLLALRKSSWLRLFEVKTRLGWEAMFVPNGQGSVEWHLGWEVVMDPNYYLIILPISGLPELEVSSGIFDYKTLNRLNDNQGVAIAVTPKNIISIQRGQPIARVVLLHPDSLKTKANFDTSVTDLLE